MVSVQESFWIWSSWPLAPVAYSQIRPKSQISIIGHDGTLSIRYFMMIVERPENPNFELAAKIQNFQYSMMVLHRSKIEF